MRLLRLVILLAAVAIVVFPAGMALAYPPANPVRALPATVDRGATFNVTVNFTAPADNFTAISLTDFVPDSWNATVNGAWCQPAATAKLTGNMTEFSWYLTPYPNGTNFIVVYKVTVPCGAALGNYTFSDDGFLGYYIGNGTTHIFENITGDFNLTVVLPAICSTPSIDFYAALNGTNPDNQTLQLWSSTPCMLNWSLSDDADYSGHDWLSENRTSGNCTNVHSSVAVSVNTSGMPVGNYTANITIASPDANNSPRIVPVSLYIRTTGTLKGQVSFAGRGDPGTDRWVEPFVVKFFDNATKLEMVWSPINATTNNTGFFTITEVVAGAYDIGIKNWTCLSEKVTNVTLNVGALTVVDFGTTREGDANNDDWVTGADRSVLYVSWGSQAGTPEYNAHADFNRDDWITGADRSLMYSVWGQCGDLV
jgi:hypothetical protein